MIRRSVDRLLQLLRQVFWTALFAKDLMVGDKSGMRGEMRDQDNYPVTSIINHKWTVTSYRLFVLWQHGSQNVRSQAAVSGDDHDHVSADSHIASSQSTN